MAEKLGTSNCHAALQASITLAARMAKTLGTISFHSYRSAVASKLASIVVDDEIGRPVLEAGDEEGEDVTQRLVPKENVVVVDEEVLARDDHYSVCIASLSFLQDRRTGVTLRKTVWYRYEAVKR
jgi:hypothetical protein